MAQMQLFLSRRGIKDHYELIERGGVSHKPVFKFRIYFNDKEGDLCIFFGHYSLHCNKICNITICKTFSAIGGGSSKQEAKHKAAMAMIAKLSGERVEEIAVTPKEM